MAAKVVSIEVGTQFTKICEVGYKAKKPKIFNCFSLKNPENTIEDGYIKDKEAFAAVLKENLKEHGIINKNVIFTIASSKIANREVSIPVVKENKIDSIVHTNATEYFPLDLSDYTIAYKIINQTTLKNEKNLNLLVLAAPLDLIRSYYGLSKELGFTIVSMDYASNAYYQVIHKEVGKGVNLAVHIGENTTFLSIMENGVLTLQRTIDFGAMALIKGVLEHPIFEKTTVEEAKELLMKEPIINTQLSKSWADELILNEGSDSFDKLRKENTAKEEITFLMRNLFSNINRALGFYNSKFKGKKINAIYLSGLGSQFEGISRLFSNEMGFEGKIVEGFYGLQVAPILSLDQRELTNYIVGIGGTIAPVGFTLPEIEKSQEKKSNRASIMVIFILSVTLSAVLGGTSTVLYFNGKNEITDLQTEVNQKSYIQKIYDQHTEAKKQVDSVNEMNALTYTPNSKLYDLIQKLEEVIPSDMHVNSLTVTTTSITMNLAAETVESVGQMLINLKEIPIIQNVKLSSYAEQEEDDGGNEVGFSVTFEYATEDSEDEKGGN